MLLEWGGGLRGSCSAVLLEPLPRAQGARASWAHSLAGDRTHSWQEPQYDSTTKRRLSQELRRGARAPHRSGEGLPELDPQALRPGVIAADTRGGGAARSVPTSSVAQMQMLAHVNYISQTHLERGSNEIPPIRGTPV